MNLWQKIGKLSHFIKELSHLCQGYHGHCIVTSSDGRMGRLGGGSFMLEFRWGDRGWVSCFFSVFCSVFMLLLIVPSWLVHYSLLSLFHCSFLLFLSLVSLIRHYYCMETVVFVL